jgi:hypothetical protein
MRLLADENFPRPAVAALREAGLDVLWISETSGAPDDAVLAQCVATQRTLRTFGPSTRTSGNWPIVEACPPVAGSSSSGSLLKLPTK